MIFKKLSLSGALHIIGSKFGFRTTVNVQKPRLHIGDLTTIGEFSVFSPFPVFFALLMGLLYQISMDYNVYFTRPNKEVVASEEEIKRFEKFALSDLGRGKQVFIIEKFPKQFFYFATKIRLEKVIEPVPSLSELSNSRLFKAISTHSLYE